MKIMITTTPLQAKPTFTAPIGSLSVINYLRKRSGPDVEIDFFNIDAHRPTFEQTMERIRRFHPDILGISAVVSTAYAFTKKLACAVKKELPGTLIVLGGNLGASAEVLLKKASVDVVVLGEGERPFLNLAKRARTTWETIDFKDTPGLIFLDRSGMLVNTGYGEPLPPDEIWDVDWTDLERDGTVDLYLPVMPLKEKLGKGINRRDARFGNLVETELRTAGLTCAKGCVARCTFCHRWDKGMRHIPVDVIIKRLEHLMGRYNVRAVSMLSESFGVDKVWLDELLEKIKPYNVLWRAGGVRTSTVDPPLIQRMKDAGCYALIYGNETGSRKMLEVMEKKVSLEDNYNAAKWTIEAGLGNMIQLVVGMPGESPETIHETIEYCKFAGCLSPTQDPRMISINFAQALPGTPLYEFGRMRGLIPPGIDAEEEYLLAISDKDAADPITCINFTNYPRLTLLSWSLLIRIEVRHHYVQKFGKAHYFRLLAEDRSISHLSPEMIESINRHGEPTTWLFVKRAACGRVSELLACYPAFFFRMRKLVEPLTLLNILREYGPKAAWQVVKDYLRWLVTSREGPWKFKYRSLRKIVDRELTPLPGDAPQMIPLRKGR